MEGCVLKRRRRRWWWYGAARKMGYIQGCPCAFLIGTGHAARTTTLQGKGFGGFGGNSTVLGPLTLSLTHVIVVR